MPKTVPTTALAPAIPSVTMPGIGLWGPAAAELAEALSMGDAGSAGMGVLSERAGWE
jgi:hypothetical protein